MKKIDYVLYVAIYATMALLTAILVQKDITSSVSIRLFLKDFLYIDSCKRKKKKALRST